MLYNYLKVGIRNILKYKTFSFTNIFGLAAAMSVCMLIILIIADQNSYDQFHKNKDRIYRVETSTKNANDRRTASSALPLASHIKKEYPAIEEAATLVKNIGGDIFYNDRTASGGGYFTDANLFRVMDFNLEQGDERTALEKPFSLVISRELAEQLFPREDPIGKVVKFNHTGINPGGPETGNRETHFGQFVITGILEPVLGKTSLPFKLLASLSTLTALTNDSILNYPPNDWSNVWTNYTYVLLKQGSSKSDLQQILNNISEQQYPKNNTQQFVFHAQPLQDIMPSDAISNPTNIGMPKIILLILGVLCLVVMLSACLNYTNLSIARQLTRAKEVGIRKVSGATRRQIFTQFITEAVLISLLSLIISFVLLLVIQRMFSYLWLNQFLNITFLYTPQLFLIFVVFSIGVGLIAGILPALYISLFDPVQILKGLNTFSAFKRLTLRKALLVVQFCVSLIFIISTSLIYLQSKHLLNFNYGFDKENIINIKLFKTENYDRYARTIINDKNISAVGGCTFPPATGNNNRQTVHKVANLHDSLHVNYIDIDAGCIDVWDLKLIAGKELPAIPGENDDDYVLINEKMANDFKFSSPIQAVGQHLKIGSNELEIIGVVKDFQFLDVSRQMEPLMLRNRKAEFGFITVKMRGEDVARTVDFLQNEWKKVNPASKFEYEFFDQQLLVTHSMMSDTAGIIGVLAFLAVLISCLGLLGMATYTVETRKKEISVRKILGSTVFQVVVLLSQGFVKLLFIAVIISLPIAFILNSMWLESFASRISIGAGVLLVNVSFLLALAILVVLSQAWKVSTANPAKSLRTE